MSNTDSFLDEVSEEVRRDQLYSYARRYGWIAVAAVVLIVGGAAYNEYRTAAQRSAAEALGGQLDAAQQTVDPAARVDLYATLATQGADADVIAGFGQAQALAEAGDAAGASALLDELRNSTEVSPLYTALATLKWAVVPGAVPPAQDRIDALTAVIDGGSQMSLLALEQRGLAYVEQGDIEAAHADFEFALADPLTTAGLRDRLTQIIIATGGTTGAAVLTTPQVQTNGN